MPPAPSGDTISYGPRREPTVSAMSLGPRRLPIEDQRNRGRLFVLDRVDQKPLTIPRDDVLLARDEGRGGRARLEKWNGFADVWCRFLDVDGHRHQLIVGRNVEQLPSVSPPSHLRPAIDRYSN